MVGISPVILASASANLSSIGSASEGDRHRTMARADSEGDAVDEILASLINGGEQIVVVDLSPRIAGELVVSC